MKLEVPTAEQIEEPWIFRAACYLKEPEVCDGFLHFGLILDLGFHTYRKIEACLDGVICEHDLTVEFATNWATNGEPNPLEAVTIGKDGEIWAVHLYRVELDIETLQSIGRSSLTDALIEQGLAKAAPCPTSSN